MKYPKCDNSNQRNSAVFASGAIYYAVNALISFESLHEIL